MTSTHSGVLQVTRESLAMIAAAVKDLPEEALDWKPLPSANSAAVLAAHAVTATRFFLRSGSGKPSSIVEYRATERAEAFRTSGVSKDAILEMLKAFSAEAETILRAGTLEHLDATVSMPSNDNLTVPDRNGAGTLFAAIGHLREHLGHLQLMHDLWLAEHPSK
jgi:hypothetical protein